MGNFESFDKSREENKSLKEIKEELKGETKEQLNTLKVDIQITKSLHKGLTIVSGDTLAEINKINEITSSENHIKWDTKFEGGKYTGKADWIYPGDTIKIIGKEVYRIPNGKTESKKVKIGEVISGFEAKSDTPIPKPKNEGQEKPGNLEDKKGLNSEIDKSIYENNPYVEDGGNMSRLKNTSNSTQSIEDIFNIPKLAWTPIPDNILKQNNSTSENVNESKEVQIQDLDILFSSFKDTIKRIDTLFDTQTSSEKISNKDLLDTNYNAIITLIKSIESQKYITPKFKNKIDNIKLYLAKHYADEGEIENSNFRNYQLSNALAFDVLGNINGINPPPKAPEMGDIISSFKGTGIGTYIISKFKEGETESNIFSSKVVKDATKESGEKLINEYEDSLEEYLESINQNKREGLSQIQKDALDLLIDVNGVGWSVKNSTTEKFDIMGWDFAAIGAGIGAGFGAGALAGSFIPGAGTLTVGAAGAIAGGFTTTLGMMVNHGDNYFGEDWKKGGTELGINTAMFGAGGAFFKLGRYIQGGSKLLSKPGFAALGVEATGDVAIGISTDMTRSWAYDMGIDLSDAIVNNLVWALMPITLRGKQGFSEVRKKLAKNISEGQKKASILAKLGDTKGAKAIINQLNKQVESVKKLSKNTTEKGKKIVTGTKDKIVTQAGKIKEKLKQKNSKKNPENNTKQSENFSNSEGKDNTKKQDPKEPKNKKNTPEQKKNSPKRKKADISESIETDLKTLKVGEDVKYPGDITAGDITVKRIDNKVYKIGEVEYPSLITAKNALKKNMSTHYQKLIINGGSKHFEKIRKSIIGKEFGKGNNIFKLDKNGELLKRGKDGGFSKVDINSLNKTQNNIILKKIMGEKGYNTLNKTFDTFSTSRKEMGKVYSGEYWAQLKKKHPGSIKTIEWIYTHSIGDYIAALKLSANAPGLKKAFLGRTLLTGKHSEQIIGNWGSAWLPSKGSMIGIGLLSGAEYATGNFTGKDLLGNYTEIVMLGWLGAVLLETPTAIDTVKGYMKVGDTAINSIERN